MRKAVGNFVRNSKGATAVEYGLILSLLVLAIVAGVTTLGASTSDRWNGVANDVAGNP